MPSVHKGDLECLRDELFTGPQGAFILGGRDMATWRSNEKEYDLVCLKHSDKEKDALSSWIYWWVTRVYHRYHGHKRREPISVDPDWQPARPFTLTNYPDAELDKIVTGITILLAPILPAISASALFFIHDFHIRLGVTVMLSFLFSAALALVGLPRRIDSFVATATFTALSIVFLSNNTACTCG
jgi:hypothetical protein